MKKFLKKIAVMLCLRLIATKLFFPLTIVSVLWIFLVLVLLLVTLGILDAIEYRNQIKILIV